MKKQTTRVTLDDLAGMIQRTVAKKKEDTDRIEDITAKILVAVKELPERVAERLLDYKGVHDELKQLKRDLREKHHLEV